MSDEWFDRLVTVALTMAFVLVVVFLSHRAKPKPTAFDCEPDFQAKRGAVVLCNDGTQVEVYGQACQRIVQQDGELLFFCTDNTIRVVRPKTFLKVKK